MTIKQIALCSFACALSAHDMYIIPSTFKPAPGQNVVVGFHIGDSFPESEVAGKLERLRDPKLTWKGGSAALQNLRADGKRNVGDGAATVKGDVIASVSTEPTLIELEPAKFAEYLKEEGLPEVIAWREKHGEASKPGKERYSKYSKALLVSGKSDGFARKPLGLIVEIVPEADPFKLKPGDALPVQVLFRGRPAADLQIEAAWSAGGQSKMTVAGRTGADGRVKVQIPTAGVWRIHTIKMERCADTAVADWESFWASMTFDVK